MIAKGLAVMDDAVLLSEVHPYGRILVKRNGRRALRHIPAVQAHQWFGLITGEELEAFKFKDRPSDFAAEILLIAARCKAKGKNLIVRDYNNVDFTGISFRARPPFHFSTVEVLRDRFRILRYFTVRHPADQWLSLSKLFTDDITPQLERFLHGFRLFSEQAAEIGFVRYEDFTVNPDAKLRLICTALDLPYGPEWRERWADYRKITGDKRARAGNDAIAPAARRPLAPALQRRFERNPDYRKSLELLGYPS